MSANIISTPNVWEQYLEEFDYFSYENIRPGCHPRMLEHEGGSAKAVVLVHGLSDSPYFVSAIGNYFHEELQYNVYMPLLHFHGLKEPDGMEGVELEEWERNVGYAVDCAAGSADVVSIGGLSTGGVLSLYMANSMPQILNGEVYLFSAALDLAGGPLGLVGEMKERLLDTFLADLFDKNKPLVGDNPYRYTHVDLDGAAELARLIKRTDSITRRYEKGNKPFPFGIFAAHSEADTTADIKGIERVQDVGSAKKFHFERYGKEEGIKHASLVLNEDIGGIDKPERANPNFDQMMAAVGRFENISNC